MDVKDWGGFGNLSRRRGKSVNRVFTCEGLELGLSKRSRETSIVSRPGFVLVKTHIHTLLKSYHRLVGSASEIAFGSDISKGSEGAALTPSTVVCFVSTSQILFLSDLVSRLESIDKETSSTPHSNTPKSYYGIKELG